MCGGFGHLAANVHRTRSGTFAESYLKGLGMLLHLELPYDIVCGISVNCE